MKVSNNKQNKNGIFSNRAIVGFFPFKCERQRNKSIPQWAIVCEKYKTHQQLKSVSR